MKAIDMLKSLHDICHFQTREGAKVGRASNSELRRWFQRNSVQVNGESILADEEIDFEVFSFVLFPKGNRVTLF